ncbi:MAG: Ig-like domain-containing protein [Rhizobiaceae bacterium]
MALGRLVRTVSSLTGQWRIIVLIAAMLMMAVVTASPARAFQCTLTGDTSAHGKVLVVDIAAGTCGDIVSSDPTYNPAKSGIAISLVSDAIYASSILSDNSPRTSTGVSLEGAIPGFSAGPNSVGFALYASQPGINRLFRSKHLIGGEAYTAVVEWLHFNSEGGDVATTQIVSAEVYGGNFGSEAEDDTEAPTMWFSNVPSSISDTSQRTIVLNFSEPVYDLAVNQGDVSALEDPQNTTSRKTADLGPLLQFVSPTQYSLTYTPQGNGYVVISVLDDTAQDAAGNLLVGASITIPYVASDTTVPQVSSVSANPDPIDENTNSVDVVVQFDETMDDTVTPLLTFSEDVSGALTDASTKTGTWSETTHANDTYTVTYTVTNSGKDIEDVGVVVSTGFRDAAGNALASDTTVPDVFDILQDTSDRIAPTVTITADKTALSPTETAQVTFTAGETGTNFDPALHATVTGGSLSNFSRADPVFTATFTPTFGSANPGAKATILVAAGEFTDAAGNDNEASNTLAIDFSNAIAQRTSRIIRNFMSRRADHITANEPDLSSRLSRGGGVGSTAGSLTGQGDLVSNNELAFSTSLSQMAAWRRAQNAGPASHVGGLPVQGYNSGEFGFGAGDAGPLPVFDVWLKGRLVQIDNGTTSSLLGLVHAGVDYAVNPDLVVGLMAQLDIMDEKDGTQGFSASGTGWLAGPYVVTRLTGNLVLDARAAWGTSDNTVSPYNTYEDAFSTERWLVAAKLTGDFDVSGITVAPHVGVIYFEEDQKSYIDSNALTIPGQTVALGRLTFGPKLTWGHVMEDGTSFNVHWSASGIWDFETADLVSLETGLAATGTTDLRARTEAGFTVRTTNSITLGVEGFYDGIGADNFEAYGGAVGVAIPLN